MYTNNFENYVGMFCVNISYFNRYLPTLYTSSNILLYFMIHNPKKSNCVPTYIIIAISTLE